MYKRTPLNNDTEVHYNDILDYWFKNKLDYNKWFYKNNAVDKYVRTHFTTILHEAESGNLLYWLNNPKSYLAMIILLDQFSRCIYRNTWKAYKNDKKALLFAEMGLDMYLPKLTTIEKMFVLFPYQHSENIHDQALGLNILKDIYNKSTTSINRSIIKKAIYRNKHTYNIIKTFSRFPTRNKYLDREDTEDEIDYMDELLEHNTLI